MGSEKVPHGFLDTLVFNSNRAQRAGCLLPCSSMGCWSLSYDLWVSMV